MFDLNFRLNYQVKSDYLSQALTDNASLLLNMKFNNPPYCFADKHLQLAKQSGLKNFSDFISLNADNELYKIIIQSIQLFASALSNWDLHLRCVNIITVLESTLLKDEERGDLEQKSKARLSKVLSNQHQEKERIKSIFTNIYQVRHKMIHKAKRIDINFKELSKAQTLMIDLFLKLIKLNTSEGFKNKVTLIEKLNNVKS